MKRKLRFSSWRKNVLALLATILFCSSISLATTYIYYRKQVNETLINKNEYYCEKWTTSVDTKLSLVYEQIKDILITLYNDTEYSKSIDSIDPFSAAKIVNILQNQTMSPQEISSIFFYDINSNYYLYNSDKRSSTVTSPMMKSYLKEVCRSEYSYLSDSRWSYKQIGGRFYFYKAIKLGRFIVGVVSDITQYIPEDEEVKAYFLLDDVLLNSEGFLADDVDFDFKDLSSRYNTKQIVATYQGPTSKIIGVIIKDREYNNLNIIIGILFVLNATVGVILLFVLFSYMKKKIAEPTKELLTATNEVSNGNLDYRMDVDKAGSDEFKELYVKFNDMTAQIGDLKIESYDMKLAEEQNRLRMLRAQVRPHTFLNGITTISNLTYGDDDEKIREYIYSFSQFTRYMLQTDSEWISIKEEINHIGNYVAMQRIRFPNSLAFTYTCDKSIEDKQIPFLLMYSLVENACKHAMDMIRTLNINIKCEQYSEEGFKGIRIIVSDDGDGFPNDVLIHFNKNDLNTKEHLGLTNVRYTLHLLYKRDDLLRLSNKTDGGARVEMLIPERD